MMKSSRELYQHFCDGVVFEPREIYLEWAGIRVALRSNSLALLDELSIYFSHCISSTKEFSTAGVGIRIAAIEQEEPLVEMNFQDWRREGGKTGRKDSYADLSDGRLLRKVRTGMVFLQNSELLLALGPCVANSNQVVNFIISQVMNRLQHSNYLICHAAAVQVNGRGLALAGFSGGGKSTLMLKLMENSDSKFISNDRLFLRYSDDGVHAVGVPKLPRVNPGTLLNNARLRDLMDEGDQSYFDHLPFSELWNIEKKYDVPIEALYGKGRILASSDLSAVIILNWRHDSDEQTMIQAVDIAARRELLAAVKKAPGPFYQDANGKFLQDDNGVDEEPYLALLRQSQVWELSGKVDIECGVKLIMNQLELEPLCQD